MRGNAGNKLLSNFQQIIKRVQIFRISFTCLFRFIELLLGRLDSRSVVVLRLGSWSSRLLLRLVLRLSSWSSGLLFGLRSRCFGLLFSGGLFLSGGLLLLSWLAIDLFFGLA